MKFNKIANAIYKYLQGFLSKNPHIYVKKMQVFSLKSDDFMMKNQSKRHTNNENKIQGHHFWLEFIS